MGHLALVLVVSCRGSAAAHTAMHRWERLEIARNRIHQRMENFEKVARTTKPMWAAVERRICCSWKWAGMAQS
jgi:hypothetical protein